MFNKQQEVLKKLHQPHNYNPLSDFYTLSGDKDEDEQEISFYSVKKKQNDSDDKLPENMDEILDQQVNKLEGEIDKTITTSIEKVILSFRRVQGKWKSELQSQFDSIKVLQGLTQSKIKTEFNMIKHSTDEMKNHLIQLLNECEGMNQKLIQQAIEYKQRLYDQIQGQKTLLRCPLCVKTCKTIASFTRHLRTQHNVPIPQGYQCLHCKSEFDKPNSLVTHLWTKHRTQNVDEWILCRGCQQIIKSYNELVVHVNTCVYNSLALDSLVLMIEKGELQQLLQTQEQPNNDNNISKSNKYDI